MFTLQIKSCLIVGEKLHSNPELKEALDVGEKFEVRSSAKRGCLKIGLGPSDRRQGVEWFESRFNNLHDIIKKDSVVLQAILLGKNFFYFNNNF